MLDGRIAPPSAIARGSRVSIHGLRRASLNGQKGTIGDFNGESGRWAVCMDRSLTYVAVKPDHLELVPPPVQNQEHAINMRDLLTQDHLYNLHPLQATNTIPRRQAIVRKSIAKRDSLVAALNRRHVRNTDGPLLMDPDETVIKLDQVLELSCTASTLTVQPRDLRAWALVSKSCAGIIRNWLASPAALPFWQRVCAGVLPANLMLHPELCTKDMLKEWAALPMAVGTKRSWHACGMGDRQRELPGRQTYTMTELELAMALAQLFTLWWNIGDDEDSPRFVGWMRLYFEPYLTGRTHETQANPGTWNGYHVNGVNAQFEHSLLADVCDCIQDFRWCPNMNKLPEELDQDMTRLLTALIAKFDCQCPNIQTQWRFMTAPQITPAKNAAFHALLKRYCPLFPQAARKERDEDYVPVVPVFLRGQRHPYLPGEERRRLLPHKANKFLILDRMNSNRDQTAWEWNTDVNDREEGILEGETIVSSDEEEEDEEEDEQGEEDEEEESEEEEEDWSQSRSEDDEEEIS